MKISDYVKNNSVNPLYIIINEVDGSIEEKVEIKNCTDRNKKTLKNIQSFGMKLNIVSKQ